ncbi:uncharacterized protein LOC128549418 [Mercenaria mercenaria]|uniref:uncharacterized protein LOC128549418 n=1 Tax=Mercenaria mercenaria TaxID=6596 RepID=UPI00234F678F|nr:uncharacterized protein LOC128549418 [Mercenaria mercenaria]
MTEIRLWDLYCTEHERSCTFSLDFSQHSDLRELVLWEIPEVSQLKVSSQVEYVNLSYINLGEMSLPPEMANIESVYLSSVNMSASTLRDLVKVVEKLSHKVTVTIFVCEIEPETEFEHVIQYIRSSQNFRVTEDGSWWGKFVFETKVECSSTWSDTQNELVPMEEDPVCALHAYSEETSSNQTASLIPEEILRMDQNSIELYKRALSDGQEVVRSIRIMVVGHTNVGKTTLTKRLFYEDVDINQREITNGIDVHVRKCNVSLDTGHWTILGKDQKMKTIYHRLMKLLQKPASNDIISGKKDNVIETVTGEGKDIGFIKPEDMSEDDSSMSEDDNDAEGEISEEDPEPIATNEHSSRKDVASVKDAEGEVYEEVSEEIATEEHPSRKEEYIRNHLKELIEKIQEHSADDKDTRTAEVSLWDFAGQSEFYATHQVFLSKNAVYLLVTDISKDAEDIVLDNTCFIDSKGAKRKVSEFVHFWLNSIHEFCSSTECKGPPVILVGTHADKLKQETKDAAVDKFFYTIRRSLYDKATYCHLIYEDFAVDNSINDDQQIELLRQKIVNTAKNLPYWEKLIPANWITLEHIIVNLKDEGLKVLYKDRLYDMNRTLPVPIETENGVELFLKFHHESGNILYYRDENLINSIVIDPQWLIDAFKSLITSRNFCSKTQETFKKWIEFDESAILTPKLVEVIWKKEENSMFYKNKQLLLDYLEKLGLIARPVQESDDAEIADFYFAPCVLKTPPPEDLLAYSDCRNRRSTSKLCFTMASGFLPSIVFNKLLAVCISKWSLPKRNYKHLVFRGCGIFDLKDNHTLYVYFFDQVIQIWITKLSAQDEEPNNAVCSKVYDFISDFLQHRLRLSSGVKVSLKCQFSDLNSNDNLFPVDEIALKSEVVCNCRTEQHVLRTDEITQYWFPCIRKEGRVFGTFIDETGIEMTVFESHVIAKASYGICLIHYPCENGFGGGTGFRVGKRYIMTAAHVANAAKHGGLTNSMAIFNYLQDSPAWPKYVYSLTSVVFSDEETDVAVIKLAENSQMPPAFEHFIAPVENFNLIGHSKKDVMKINPVTKVFIEGKCPRLSDEISRTRSLSREHTAAPCDFEQFNSLTNKDRFLFHCKFTKGASGSPGIVLKGNNIHVTTVLVYGYPDWYYDPTQARLREIWPIKYCIEQGANMQSVCRNMFKADTQLCREIFGEFINCC